MDSIYKKIKVDFSFLNHYGYYYCEDMIHYVQPSVMFTNLEITIKIGYRYDENRIYICYYKPASSYKSIDLQINYNPADRSYESQLRTAQDYLKSVLDNGIL